MVCFPKGPACTLIYMERDNTLEAVMKRALCQSGNGQQADINRAADAKRADKRTRLFSQLAHDWEYEGDDVHLGSEAITVYAV